MTGVVKAHPFHAVPHHSTLLWNRAGVPSVPQCSTSPEHCGTPPTFTDEVRVNVTTDVVRV